MSIQRLPLLLALVLSLLNAHSTFAVDTQSSKSFRFENKPGSVNVIVDQQVVASYVYQDEQVTHPYWHTLRTKDGLQVTRNHPPKPPADRDDHVGLHTGLWLSFGDISGNDYWRLKTRCVHKSFEIAPENGLQDQRFSVINEYLDKDSSVIALEKCRFDFKLIEDDYLLIWESTFEPQIEKITFGDQEEMGLGIRVASTLAVDNKQGGRILDSQGRRNGTGIWGKTVQWVDYSGPLDAQWAGIAILVDDHNFRPSWCHARDYGFLALNPFGRKAFTGGEASSIELKKGETLQLRYGVLIHQSPTEAEFSVTKAWKEFSPSKPTP